MDNAGPNSVASLALAAAPRRAFPWLHVVLFLTTAGTTLVAGALMMLSFDGDDAVLAGGVFRALLDQPMLLAHGVPFSAAFLLILLAHEMGHYLTCRYYGISATLPYFIPAPTPVGSLGAFIRIRSPIQHRAALLDVGVAGPIAGFVVSIPVLVLALTRSRYVELDPAGDYLSLGEPLIFQILARVMGVLPPEGMELHLHPVGFAAWVGFLLTALNLLPVGQLDGGHIAYALFRRFHLRISRGLVFALLPLGVFFWLGWLLWIVLLTLLGTHHPPTLDDARPLERRHIVLGWVALLLFVLCFMPTPTRMG